MREDYLKNIDEVIKNMNFKGSLIDYKPYGNGHINDTFLVRFKDDNVINSYILQRMNHNVFKKPIQVMENIQEVTLHLKKKIREAKGDPSRETLNIVTTKEGQPLYQNKDGAYWRAFLFIDNAITYQNIEEPKDFYEIAYAFGRFQNMLSDFPVENLHETIVDFHNTPKRLERLKEAIEDDKFDRKKNVKEEIEFIMNYQEFTSLFEDLKEKGILPVRVTHNDTKIDNIMIDKTTKKAICVIDLDTVMPGYSVNDFGDSIRTGASTAAEDEKDLSKVKFSLKLYEEFAKGFIKGCGNGLEDVEIENLAEGAKMMTLESAIRFLTDYLEGDTYFKIKYPEHNLIRSRTQIKLIKDMEEKWKEMKGVIKK